MSIFYNKVQRTTNPSDKTAEKKWYPIAKSISQATEKEVAAIISDETTLNPKEAEMAIAQARKAILILLKAGHTVKLGDWATFKVTLRAEGTDTEEACTASKIKKVVPHCTFSKDFLTELQKASFQSTKTMEKKAAGATDDSTDGDNGSSGSTTPGQGGELGE